MKFVQCFLTALSLSFALGCGLRKVEYNALISHGFESDAGYFPWHVAISHVEWDKNVYRCGGTLIGRTTVLTAAVCVFTLYGQLLRPEFTTVQLGVRFLSSGGSSAVAKVRNIEVHPDYDKFTLASNLAKITLMEDVQYTDFIQPICLWDKDKIDLSHLANKLGTIVGWGLTEKNYTTSDALQEITIPVVPSSLCNPPTRFPDPAFSLNNSFCAGYSNGSNACKGDTGGGIYFEESHVWKIRGVISSSETRTPFVCRYKNDFIVFTDVAKYLEWIVGPVKVTGSWYLLEDSGKPVCRTVDVEGLDCGLWKPQTSVLSYDSSVLETGDFPWAAAILGLKNDEQHLLCGGSLISSKTIITASECVLDRNRQRIPLANLTVMLGATNWKWARDGVLFRIEKIDFRGDFYSRKPENDLALVSLTTEVQFSDSFQPVCLKLRNDYLDNKLMAYYITWTISPTQQVLSMSKMKLFSYSDCRAVYNDTSLSFYFPYCGKRLENGPDYFAPGGGLVVYENGVWRLIGVSSLGLQADCDTMCKRAKVVLFADVQRHSHWISIKEQFSSRKSSMKN